MSRPGPCRTNTEVFETTFADSYASGDDDERRRRRRWSGGSGSDAIHDISGYLVESSPLAALSKRRRRAPFNAAATLLCTRVSPQSLKRRIPVFWYREGKRGGRESAEKMFLDTAAGNFFSFRSVLQSEKC